MKVRNLKEKLCSLYSKYYNRFIKDIRAKSEIWVKHILKRCKYLLDKVMKAVNAKLQLAKTWISQHKEKFMHKLNNLCGLTPKEIQKGIREIHKALSSNEVFLENRWGRLERIIVWCSKHVFCAVIFFIILLIIIFFLLAVLLIIFIPEPSECLTETKLDLILSLPSTIFRAQVTMLGIIFPVIIGFVAILLQGKPYNEPVWKIYKHNSGFVFAIFSFLALTIVFVLYQLFRSWWLSDQVSIAASISIACWFIVNLLLSGWFFGKTIQFLSPSRRLEAVTKYIINEMPPYAMQVEHFNQEWAKYVNERMAAGLDPSEPPPISNLSILQHFIRAERLFLAVFSEVETTLKDNSPQIFRSAKNDLVKFYETIISAMFLERQEGEPDNLLLRPAREGLTLRTHIDMFIGGTHQISKSVVGKIQNDENYYRDWCYFYINLFGTLEINISEEMARRYIEGHYYIWREMVEYINSSNLSEEKKYRVFIRYKKSWNSWSSLLIRRDIGNKRLIDTSNFSCVKEHLNRTSCMLINAVACKNFEAAGQAVDILGKWFETFSIDTIRYDVAYYRYAYNHWSEGRQQKLFADSITLTLVEDKNIDTYLEKLEITPEESYERQASTIALQNYWVDIRFVTAAYLMKSPKYHHADEYKKYIQNILLGYEEPNARITGRGQYSKPIFSIESILDVYIRQNDCWRIDNQSSYLEILLGHFEKLSDTEKPMEVRLDEALNSCIIIDDPLFDKDILPFYQVMGIGLAEPLLDPNLLSGWKDFLTSDAIPKENLYKVISELQKLTSIDYPIITKVCHQFNIKRDEAERRCDNFIRLIDNICGDWEKEYWLKD